MIWDINNSDTTTPVIVSYDSLSIVFHFFTNGYSSYPGVQCQVTSSSGAGLSTIFFEPVDFKVCKAHRFCGKADVSVKLKNFSGSFKTLPVLLIKYLGAFKALSTSSLVVSVKRHLQVLHS